MIFVSRPILIVEDNDEDFTVTEWALKKSLPNVLMIRCKDGGKAIEYLEAATTRLPSIILLDLNLPRTSGHQVLHHIKACERLLSLPVIIFSSSSSREDVRACYQNGANSYLMKPIGMTESLELMRGLVEYWLHLSLLPEMTDGD